MSIEAYRSETNGLAAYQSNQNIPPVRPRTVERLTEWAEAAQAAYSVAESLVKTSFVPLQFRDKPHEATAAILAGDEVGLSPMASLNAFSIIQNTAAPKAITLRAIVQSRGHEVWQVEVTDSRAIFRGRRAGSAETHESVWTLDRARGLGLLGKDNWKTQPKTMLMARATSEVCRLTAADAILGIPYSAEELADGMFPDWAPETQVETQPPAAPAPAPRTAQRRTQPRAAPATAPIAEPETAEADGPPLPGENEPAEQPQTEPGITKPQRDKIMAMFDEAGIKNRETRLEASRLIVRRLDLTSANDLTRTEASTLIDELEGFAQSEVGLAENIAELLGRGDAEAGDPS